MKRVIDSGVLKDVRQTALRMGAETRRREVRRGNVSANKRRAKKVLRTTSQPDENVGRQSGEGTTVSPKLPQ